MGLTFSINLLTFAIFVLTAVIVSKKARTIVKNIVDKGIPSLLSFLGSIIFILLVILFVQWGWQKLHKIFPNMWSLKEIIAVVLSLIFFGFLYNLYEKARTRATTKGINLDRIIKRELYTLMFFLIGIIILVIPLSKYGFGYIILIFIYPVYLIGRFII